MMRTNTVAARREERLEYRLYCALLFTVCLPLALIGRILPRGLKPFRRAPGVRGSIFAEAKAAAHATAPFVFMG